MNYELAKQLNDAGFPQGGNGRSILPPDQIVARSHDRVYVPTLSELIEACVASRPGAPFRLYHKNGKWRAQLSNDQTSPWYFGSSPEEAVARLWLALNKI
jgi:hypothetical protein